MNKKITKTYEFGGRPLVLETGLLAPYATAAVKISLGETVVLATVTTAQAIEEKDYFPLRVDYEERLYAGGVIKGSRFIKREGRPTDEAILGSRLIDRTIRPLFPAGFQNEVQVVATVLSVDRESNPQLVALLGVAAALEISSIPFMGPVGAVYIGGKVGSFSVNPSMTDVAESDLELLVSATRERVVMIEASAKEVPEETMLEAIELGFNTIQEFTKILEVFRKEVGQEKLAYISTKVDKEVLRNVQEYAEEKVKSLIDQDFDNRIAFNALIAEAIENFKDSLTPVQVQNGMNYLRKSYIRNLILKGEKRVDGRGLEDIRELGAEIGILPRTHGSALFQRGQTQVLTVSTLGSSSLEQLLEGMEGETTKRYIHHYNANPFSVGEVGPMRGPGRREIGHGALAEKALLPVLPSEDTFPYTVRLVSEVLGQNGSSSMASTCCSSLALMDAGVPIARHVAGISMGLVEGEDSTYKLLTDIRGIEDFNGDMDFKITGSRVGITAIQLDVKNSGLTQDILKETVARSKQAREKVLDLMEKVISEPRAKLSEYAPRIFTMMIDPEKIGAVIGSGGRVIKGLIQQTGAEISVEDDGRVVVSSESEEKARQALGLIEGIVKEPEAGEVYTGKVVRIMDFGAFVEILPGKDGLVHISELAHQRVNRVEDVVNLGDMVEVKVKEIDSQGRVNLSIKALQPRPEGMVDEPPYHSERPPRRPSFGGDRGSRPPRRFSH